MKISFIGNIKKLVFSKGESENIINYNINLVHYYFSIKNINFEIILNFTEEIFK